MRTHLPAQNGILDIIYHPLDCALTGDVSVAANAGGNVRRLCQNDAMSHRSSSAKSSAALRTEPTRFAHTAAAKIGLVIPTLNAGSRWAECLDCVNAQSLRPYRLLCIDSESTDETTALARSAGFEVVTIHRHDFNHGGTRQWAVEYLRDCDVIIFLTQDAIPANRDAFEQIVHCFEDPAVAVAYGRQIPHNGATSIECHARIFNYGSATQKKDRSEVPRLGTKVFFCSNSFAAYRSKVIAELGGFRRDLILGEDMEFAARVIKAGLANMYCAGAAVRHSHDYTVTQVLARYFDIGVFDATNSWLRQEFGSHSGEGARFVVSELRYLIKNRRLFEIPRSLTQTAAKLAGYRLGRLQKYLPRALKKRLSTVPSYWAGSDD